MATRSERANAILKGLGQRPTSFLLRYSPSFKNPFQFDLLEVFTCDTDGGVVTRFSAQSPLGTHAGHKLRNPNMYSLWQWIKAQFRVIR